MALLTARHAATTAMALPVLFLSHGGGPCFFMDMPPSHPMHEMGPTSRAAAFLRGLSAHPSLAPVWPPKAILVVSAHWEESAFTVQEGARPPLLFDYHGFPPETYRLTWPAPGAPAVAARVRSLLAGAGLPAAGDSGKRGFDHGVFVPLKLVEPDAGIPTLQLSLHGGLDPALHLRAGAALAPLRREGVLIVGSGYATHNLGAFFSGERHSAASPAPWAAAFDGWLVSTVTGGDPVARVAALADPEGSAPRGTFRKAHPREEHLLPLHVVVGAADPAAVEAGLRGGAVAAAAAAVAPGGSVAPTDSAAAAAGGNATAPSAGRALHIFSHMVRGVGSMSSFLLE